MASREPVNILILGGSYAGLSVAHQFLRKIIDTLGTTRTAPKYRVVLVSPSTHFYWNVGAPRAICSRRLVPETEAFLSIQEHFKAYPAGQFRFVQGQAVNVNFLRRTVDVQLATGAIDIWPYHGLVFATGCSAESDLLSLHGDYSNTVHALHKFHLGLTDASSIVIVGGGPSGVECAGQLATWVNREQNRRVDPTALEAQKSSSRRSQFISSTANQETTSPASDHRFDSQAPLKITLISGRSRLLPKLPADAGARAEKQLKSLGVNIMHNVRLITAQKQPSSTTHCVLSTDLTLVTDLFIGATGVRPNTSFLPPELLDVTGHITSDPHFCRVARAGDRVYAIGSVTSASNSLADIYRALPVLLHNMKNDLITFEIKTQHPYGGGEEAISRLKDHCIDVERDYKDVSVLCPTTRWGGVGVIRGHSIPALAVWALKGKDYGFKAAKKVVNLGASPFT
jgi:apoptosis-inducing factor 2